MTDNYSYVLDLVNAPKELTETIIRDIVRRIVKSGGKITDTAAYQAEIAQQAGALFDDIVKAAAKASGQTEKEIKAAFKDAKVKIFDYDDTVIEAAGFDPVKFKSISPQMAKIWKAALAKTCTEAVNLTKTTAVTTQSRYIQACDMASMQVSSGALDYNTAIKNAILDSSAQGATVIYPSGWVDTLDTAVRRSTLTSVNQTAGQLQLMRAEEFGNDTMEISAHSGARWEHALWQGKLVSLSGKKGYLSLRDIGYGDIRGFMGANCSHRWHIFWVGISTPAYTNAQLEEFKNETVTYNGKKVEKWKAIDHQRALERDIKKKKRQLVGLDEAIKAADNDDLKLTLKREFDNMAVKLKRREAQLKDFCNQTGIPRQRSREQVFSAKTEQGIKSWSKSASQKAVWANKKIVDNSAKNGIMKIQGGKVMNINNIDSPIEQRNTAKGNPNAIIQFARPLSNRQQKLLDNLPEYDSSVTVRKSDVNMRDLAALTAHTGDEFALFTKGKKRLVIRGNSSSVKVDVDRAKELNALGYKWSGHTHPGFDYNSLQASPGDKFVLQCFKQNIAYIYNSKGQYLEFEKE